MGSCVLTEGSLKARLRPGQNFPRGERSGDWVVPATALEPQDGQETSHHGPSDMGSDVHGSINHLDQSFPIRSPPSWCQEWEHGALLLSYRPTLSPAPEGLAL